MVRDIWFWLLDGEWSLALSCPAQNNINIEVTQIHIRALGWLRTDNHRVRAAEVYTCRNWDGLSCLWLDFPASDVLKVPFMWCTDIVRDEMCSGAKFSQEGRIFITINSSKISSKGTFDFVTHQWGFSVQTLLLLCINFPPIIISLCELVSTGYFFLKLVIACFIWCLLPRTHNFGSISK
jgi:hypothetical protein